MTQLTNTQTKPWSFSLGMLPFVVVVMLFIGLFSSSSMVSMICAIGLATTSVMYGIFYIGVLVLARKTSKDNTTIKSNE